MKERVVLAYSGGLDTSVAIGWIAEATGAEVIAVAADVGQGGEDLDVIRERALACGAVEAEVADARDEFAEEYCLPALKANALYMDRYPLVSALSRPLIVKHLVAAARKHGASVVAHGCTGKGNDQVRFEVGIGALAPDLSCLAPVRDFALTRDKAIDYAERARRCRSTSTKKSPYSIDQNVWGRAVETGFLEDIWNAPIEDVYAYTADPAVPRDARRGRHHLRPRRPGRDRRPAGHDARGDRQQLNARAGAQGVGRLDLVEDRLVGIKSREVYEAPGAIALITAHAELENVTVERDLARFKRGVEQRWGELVYDGLWFSPLKRALDAFFDERQRARLRRRPDDPARRAARSSPAGAASSRCTTSTSPPTTRATASTSRWPRASSSCGACRARSPPSATSGWRGHRWPDEPTAALGRPLRLRPVGGPGRAVGVGALRLAAGAVRPRRIAGARPGARTAPGCSTTPSSPRCSARSTPSRRPSVAARSADRRRRGRAHRAGARPASSGSGTLGGKLRAGRAATTRSPPTSGSTCVTTRGWSSTAVRALQRALLDQAERHVDTAAPGFTHLQIHVEVPLRTAVLVVPVDEPQRSGLPEGVRPVHPLHLGQVADQAEEGEAGGQGGGGHELVGRQPVALGGQGVAMEGQPAQQEPRSAASGGSAALVTASPLRSPASGAASDRVRGRKAGWEVVDPRTAGRGGASSRTPRIA